MGTGKIVNVDYVKKYFIVSQLPTEITDEENNVYVKKSVMKQYGCHESKFKKNDVITCEFEEGPPGSKCKWRATKIHSHHSSSAEKPQESEDAGSDSEISTNSSDSWMMSTRGTGKIVHVDYEKKYCIISLSHIENGNKGMVYINKTVMKQYGCHESKFKKNDVVTCEYEEGPVGSKCKWRATKIYFHHPNSVEKHQESEDSNSDSETTTNSSDSWNMMSTIGTGKIVHVDYEKKYFIISLSHSEHYCKEKMVYINMTVMKQYGCDESNFKKNDVITCAYVEGPPGSKCKW